MIQNSLRSGDIFARIGGDEFAVILPSTTRKKANAIMEKIQRDIGCYNKNNKKYKFSISSGTATANNPLTSIEQILKKADIRMYINKREKRKETGIIN